MASLNLIEDIKAVEARLTKPEQMLGKELLQPFACTNSGARKILHANQADQRLALVHPEIPLVQTGYENQYGEFSSSFIKADDDYEVLAKINKFSKSPGLHYYLIIKNDRTKTIDMIERVSYSHITETYGYLDITDNIDRLKPGDTIMKGSIINKSQAFDEYNNRMDGVNLETAYLSCEYTMEDGIMISESASKKLASPLLKKVSVIINDNDIPLNIYGDDNQYKSFPDIDEEISNSILCAIRREKKEEALYSQSYSRLKETMMSDEKYTLNGKVIDINIMCNNPDNINNEFYNSQLSYYYNDSMRFYNDFVSKVNIAVEETGYTMTYALNKMYYNSSQILNGAQFINERLFSNIIIEFMVLELNEVHIGDKLTDRYGGKGVVSVILPDNLMPKLDNGLHVEIIKNQNTCFNRENIAQLFELSLNHISERIVQYINYNILDISECVSIISTYFRILDNNLANEFDNVIANMPDDDVVSYLDSLCNDFGIILSLEPISTNMTIDTIANLYDAFPWAVPNMYACPIKDSNGNIRFVRSRRPIICGKIYTYRLKQYAEEKNSATSLSSTNIKNENSRNKSNRSFKSSYARTPIRFGNMEIADLLHIGAETVITNLMLYSSSPHARRLISHLLTDDPYNIDIKLDNNSKNRSVEIVQAYLKTMGLRLVFKKIPRRKTNPVTIRPVKFVKNNKPFIKPVKFKDDPDFNDNRFITPLVINPVDFIRNNKDNE